MALFFYFSERFTGFGCFFAFVYFSITSLFKQYRRYFTNTYFKIEIDTGKEKQDRSYSAFAMGNNEGNFVYCVYCSTQLKGANMSSLVCLELYYFQ